MTAQGEILHERVHSEEKAKRNNTVYVRSLQIYSAKLGLSGQTDLVEFRKNDSFGVRLNKYEGLWTPFIVEYKRSKPKDIHAYEIQLTAQNMCLEEMYGINIAEGAVYYGMKKKRETVVFSDALKEETEDLCYRLHELIKSGKTPAAVYSAKCKSCSMLELCMPKSCGGKKTVRQYLKKMLEDSL
jgi:CRISPR-associated exonuclease Cas4